ncbi:pyridoxal 5'-phosphate synthase glutaminase subunit PdxT [Paenibacillus thermoaerophilus]|uniref:Pyridoxal 5'-phosphate synthase subunit PdxT n=1 Tax=Paenibacillus thermoaerophilus TaxID=1215385 RepID=A0ABW2V910_9BACL|nr:pyridoxal 5'-phosphate synthase glutaminase subunit PdxT [Paenibacillus thermoaerophilus]TMV12458.1 pyridoxal 5'-phosphate synthase glutaminase subunit PdxT [Paenibacillus thermoaerophilus]
MKIGVLALQGAVAEHVRMIEATGAESAIVKRTEQLESLDGIILPGGESTTIGKLMREYGFIEELRRFAESGKPVFGTCAGLILLANRIEGQDEAHLRLMDITVARNAFGRQRESFETDLHVKGIDETVRAVFIRAPLITQVGEGVEVLSIYRDQIVAARQGHLLAASFHPELTDDTRMHEYFAGMVRESKATTAAK